MVAGSRTTRQAGTVATVAGWTTPIPFAAESNTQPSRFFNIVNPIREWLEKAWFEKSREGEPRISVEAFGEHALQFSELEKSLAVAAHFTRTVADALAEAEDQHGTLQEGVGFSLTKEAKQIWLAYQDSVAKTHEGKAPVLQALLLRIADIAVGKIAACFHVIRFLGRNDERVVSAEEMVQAMKIGDILLDHALETWESTLQKRQAEQAEKVLDLVRREGWTVFSAGDCAHFLKGRLFPSIEPLNETLDILVEHGYIRPLSLKGKNGRSMVRYELNPVLVQGRMDTRISKVCDKGRRLCPSGSCRKLQARG